MRKLCGLILSPPFCLRNKKNNLVSPALSQLSKAIWASAEYREHSRDAFQSTHHILVLSMSTVLLRFTTRDFMPQRVKGSNNIEIDAFGFLFPLTLIVNHLSLLLYKILQFIQGASGTFSHQRQSQATSSFTVSRSPPLRSNDNSRRTRIIVDASRIEKGVFLVTVDVLRH